MGRPQEKLLRWWARGSPQPDPLGEVAPGYGATVAELRDEDWEWLSALPYFLRLGGLLPDGGDAVVVHAGLVPGLPLERQRPDDMMHIRTLDPETREPSHKFEGVPWAGLWQGPEVVVFGHDAKRGLQEERRGGHLESRSGGYGPTFRRSRTFRGVREHRVSNRQYYGSLVLMLTAVSDVEQNTCTTVWLLPLYNYHMCAYIYIYIYIYT